jgi:DNA-binding NtrC family response regulator
MVENVSKEASKCTILVVDDEESIRKLIVTFLSKLGHSCLTAVDGVDALDKMKGNKIDAVVTDIKMPNMDGITLMSEILAQQSDLPIMVMTAFGEEYSAGIAISSGAREFIKKPFSLDEFAIRLHKMINDSETQRRMKREKDEGKAIQEFMNESGSPNRTKKEKDEEDGIRELLDDLEGTLKKS